LKLTAVKASYLLICIYSHCIQPVASPFRFADKRAVYRYKYTFVRQQRQCNSALLLREGRGDEGNGEEGREGKGARGQEGGERRVGRRRGNEGRGGEVIGGEGRGGKERRYAPTVANPWLRHWAVAHARL